MKTESSPGSHVLANRKGYCPRTVATTILAIFGLGSVGLVSFFHLNWGSWTYGKCMVAIHLLLALNEMRSSIFFKDCKIALGYGPGDPLQISPRRALEIIAECWFLWVCASILLLSGGMGACFSRKNSEGGAKFMDLSIVPKVLVLEVAVEIGAYTWLRSHSGWRYVLFERRYSNEIDMNLEKDVVESLNESANASDLTIDKDNKEKFEMV